MTGRIDLDHAPVTMATACDAVRYGWMDARNPLQTAASDRRIAMSSHVLPCAERDGVGNALRAIYDRSVTAPDLPNDFSRLLDRLG